MTKRIIILERQGNQSFSVAFWLDVPVARQPFYANASATSRYKDALAAEITAIQSGAIKEVVDNVSADVITNLAGIKTQLQAIYTAKQAAINALNNWDRYGSFFDGTSWTAGGVA